MAERLLGTHGRSRAPGQLVGPRQWGSGISETDALSTGGHHPTPRLALTRFLIFPSQSFTCHFSKE